MLSSFKAIEEYTKGISYDEFINNRMCMDAVIRNFEIIGETANYVSNNFKVKHQQIVWDIIENEIPDYIKRLEDSKN